MPISVTPEHIDSVIVSEFYTRVPDSTMTICALHLVNGAVITGESACVDPANFDAEKGRIYALEDAKRKIWQLEGYLLREKMAKEPTTAKARVELELEELKEKLVALGEFLDAGQPAKVDDIGWELLHEQRKHMRAYRDVLETRLESWG